MRSASRSRSRARSGISADRAADTGLAVRRRDCGRSRPPRGGRPALAACTEPTAQLTATAPALPEHGARASHSNDIRAAVLNLVCAWHAIAICRERSRRSAGDPGGDRARDQPGSAVEARVSRAVASPAGTMRVIGRCASRLGGSATAMVADRVVVEHTGAALDLVRRPDLLGDDVRGLGHRAAGVGEMTRSQVTGYADGWTPRRRVPGRWNDRIVLPEEPPGDDPAGSEARVRCAPVPGAD